MKLPVSMFLLAVLMFQVFLKVSIIGSFYFNQSYISNNLCINRDKPASHCNGKCYLKKQLNKADEAKNNPKTNSRKQRIQLQEYIVTRNIYKIFQAGISICLITVTEKLVSNYFGSIFHPPKLARVNIPAFRFNFLSMCDTCKVYYTTWGIQ